MTPEEFEKFKAAEKEHLKKLRELKRAVTVLDRQRKIRDALTEMTEASSDVLQTQADMVERLAFETAEQEARLEIALDSVAETSKPTDEALEEELRQARARALVEKLRDGELRVDAEGNLTGGSSPKPVSPRGGSINPTTASRAESGADPTRSPQAPRSGEADQKSPDQRPEKTIGRM
ncbi:MAG: hypothetical protein WD275_01905 [Rhodothermales bacterium]